MIRRRCKWKGVSVWDGGEQERGMMCVMAGVRNAGVVGEKRRQQSVLERSNCDILGYESQEERKRLSCTRDS